jgi:hypothetical protein
MVKLTTRVQTTLQSSEYSKLTQKEDKTTQKNYPSNSDELRIVMRITIQHTLKVAYVYSITHTTY